MTNNRLFNEFRQNDVISYICVDINKIKPYLIVNSEKPKAQTVLGKMLDAFNIYGNGMEMSEDSIWKTIEFQTGFAIPEDQLNRMSHVGTVFVDDMIDRFCHLFILNVTDLERNQSIVYNQKIESIWVGRRETFILNSWKPMTIILKTEILSEKREEKAEMNKERKNSST